MADDNESTPFGTHSHGGRSHSHGVKREDTHGSRTLEALANISQTKQGEKVKRSLELGLEAADSINDRTISLFSRGHQPAFAGIIPHHREGGTLRHGGGGSVSAL